MKGKENKTRRKKECAPTAPFPGCSKRPRIAGTFDLSMSYVETDDEEISIKNTLKNSDLTREKSIDNICNTESDNHLEMVSSVQDSLFINNDDHDEKINEADTSDRSSTNFKSNRGVHFCDDANKNEKIETDTSNLNLRQSNVNKKCSNLNEKQSNANQPKKQRNNRSTKTVLTSFQQQSRRNTPEGNDVLSSRDSSGRCSSTSSGYCSMSSVGVTPDTAGTSSRTAELDQLQQAAVALLQKLSPDEVCSQICGQIHYTNIHKIH